MKSAYITFLRNLLIFSAILCAIALVIGFFIPKGFFSPSLPFILVFFIATTLLSYYYLLKAIGRRFIKFVNTFLLSIILKLFLYSGILILYAYLNRQDAVPFILAFLIAYLLYTVFESVSIIRLSRPAEDSNQTPVS